MGVRQGPLLPPDAFSSFALLASHQEGEVDVSLENVVRPIMACCAFSSPCTGEGYPASPSAPARLHTAMAPAWPMVRDSREGRLQMQLSVSTLARLAGTQAL